MSLAPWLPPLFGLMNTSNGLFWRWENGFTWETMEMKMETRGGGGGEREGKGQKKARERRRGKEVGGNYCTTYRYMWQSRVEIEHYSVVAKSL